jgi:GNAT superfamily N-acetyltransferase
MTIETTTVLFNDRWVTIRPIRSTDSAIEADFVRKLSAATKRFRFLCARNELSPTEASRFCDIDGPNSMAFIATVRHEGREVQIGVCRYALAGNSDVREMAITIADEWQHTELAKLLMQHLLASAKQYGIRRLYTMELADNQAMRKFAQEFGMATEREPGNASQVIYSFETHHGKAQPHLTSPPPEALGSFLAAGKGVVVR